VQVSHPRAVRRHLAGADDLAARLVGRAFTSAERRGKYFWFPLAEAGESRAPSEALVAHLGMSGQFLVRPSDAPDEKHLHVRILFADGDPQLRFVDQRTFGGLLVDDVVLTPDGGAVPAQIAHIARDPMDPLFDDAGFISRLRRRNSAVKRALLDQTLISGVGNIYADEALWRARLHGERLGRTLTRRAGEALLAQVRAVLREAIEAGGTSFDSLYVNVNGQSGYFDRSLAVYGRENEPCPRCGSLVRRSAFMNRSSYYCPRCQRPPRPAPRSVA
jgi:formamidopyrimidine-DNA glycosylase